LGRNNTVWSARRRDRLRRERLVHLVGLMDGLEAQQPFLYIPKQEGLRAILKYCPMVIA
jgi:hypothetical protein